MKNSNAELLPPGSVIVCTRATIGEAAINTVPMATNQGFKSIIPTQDVDSDFLYYLVRSLKREFVRRAAGSTFLEISASSFAKIPVRIPDSLEVQRWLVRPLILLDDIAIALQDLIAAKREFKRGLMQELLTGRRRFPEYGPSHNGTEGPPAGWKEVKLGDLGRVVSGGTPSTKVPEYWDGGIAWCTPSDITALKSPFIDGTERELSEKGVENSSAEVLPPYSVIVCTRATIGAAAINRIPMATNQGFKSIIPEEGYCAEFIYYLVLHNRNQLLRRAAGSTFLEVSADSFSSLPVFVPESTAEQRRIADVLLRLDEEIQLLEQLLDQFDINKRGLMQKLLTGELTIPVSSEPEPLHA